MSGEHEIDEIDRLARKADAARLRLEKRRLRMEIARLYLPRFHVKFNKAVVVLCIAAIVAYTVAASVIQERSMVEVSPTLTTCFFAFFGTELLGLAGIKCFDTRYGEGRPPAGGAPSGEGGAGMADADWAAGVSEAPGDGAGGAPGDGGDAVG